MHLYPTFHWVIVSNYTLNSGLNRITKNLISTYVIILPGTILKVIMTNSSLTVSFKIYQSTLKGEWERGD